MIVPCVSSSGGVSLSPRGSHQGVLTQTLQEQSLGAHCSIGTYIGDHGVPYLPQNSEKQYHDKCKNYADTTCVCLCDIVREYIVDKSSHNIYTEYHINSSNTSLAVVSPRSL